ncbi:MAG: hypothetical protein CVV11_19985 [Gammaproteobacteria bacterium HGW-Gammaproteobacteria-15]|nr:MAG: hypothetical protein CVV11_19985 [Gammaproteobacteria bacterium HGW-Gammaproteobacteria-15]
MEVTSSTQGMQINIASGSVGVTKDEPQKAQSTSQTHTDTVSISEEAKRLLDDEAKSASELDNGGGTEPPLIGAQSDNDSSKLFNGGGTEPPK